VNQKIVWLTGASGVGKTTLLQNLKDKYSSKQAWEFLKFDSIGVPSNEEMVREFGSVENWQKAKTHEWIKKMVQGYPNKELIVMDGQANIEFIKSGFEKESFTNYQIILVDCDQDTMVKRLVDERQQVWLASEDMKNWLQFLRKQAQTLNVPIINTSKLDKAQTVAEFEKITS
jgi:tRNA uridine 5-carbamoylmethylation protein Kti12